MRHLRLTAIVLYLSLSLTAQPTDTSKGYTLSLPAHLPTITLVAIPAGSFTMGALPADSLALADELPASKVSVSGFWMSSMEITHDIFNLFYLDSRLSQGIITDAITRPTAQYIDMSLGMGKEGGYPVNSLSQDAALMFCKWLYQQTGQFYRLPTEAEWEYACRAGATTIYPYANDTSSLSEYAWWSGNSKGKYQKTGQKKPNAWGLYDMLGNLSEWVLDQYDSSYFLGLPNQHFNPLIVPKSRYPKSLRGGSYKDPETSFRISKRMFSTAALNKRDPQIPKSRWWLTEGAHIGFRIVRPFSTPSPEAIDAFFSAYLGK